MLLLLEALFYIEETPGLLLTPKCPRTHKLRSRVGSRVQGLVHNFGHWTSGEPVCYLSLETVFNTFHSVLLVAAEGNPQGLLRLQRWP